MKKYIIISADFICSFILLLFLYTAVNKLANYQQFKFTLSRSPLLKNWSGTLAWLLPVSEIAISVLLFGKNTRIKGLFISLLLLGIFTLYLAYMVLYTRDLPCNCGGVLRHLTWTQHIFFNLFCASLSLTGIILYKKHKEAMKQTPP